MGAQVGETGILFAAGRTLAAHLPALAFAEGSCGTWLLAEDVTFENVAFGGAAFAEPWPQRHGEERGPGASRHR